MLKGCNEYLYWDKVKCAALKKYTRVPLQPSLSQIFFLEAEITVINRMIIIHFTRRSGLMVNYFRKLVNEFLITSPQQFEHQLKKFKVKGFKKQPIFGNRLVRVTQMHQ